MNYSQGERLVISNTKIQPPLKIGIGILGLGIIGSEFANSLLTQTSSLREKTETDITISKVLIRNKKKRRSVNLPGDIFTTTGLDVINDPNTNIVVELLGGTDPAFDLIRKALLLRIPVITANKELVAKHGEELQKIADTNEVDFLYEAAVGGGIPLIATVKRGLAGTKIEIIKAIINGTTNYILSEMSKSKIDFDVALQKAQDLGYAEPDPTNDINGNDAAFKISILSNLAFNAPIHTENIYTEGITKITLNDFQYADELGYAIKLLAIAKRSPLGSIDIRVHPALVNKNAPLAKVNGVLNAIEITGDLIGEVMFSGEGAGSKPTTNSILSDLIEIAQNLKSNNKPHSFPSKKIDYSLYSIDQIEIRYYIRLLVSDKPGMMAKITQVLGNQNISIASVVQRENTMIERVAEIVLMTHKSVEKKLFEAIQDLDKLEGVREIATVIRLEE